MSHCKLSILGLLYAASATQQTHAQVLIDGFNPVNHAHDFTFGSSEYVNRSFVRVFAGSMIGSERDAEYFQELATNAAGTPQFFTKFAQYEGVERFTVGGRGPGASQGRAKGYIELQYDRNGDEVDNTGFDRHLRSGGTGQPFFVGDHYGIRVRSAANGGQFLPTTVTLRRQGAILESSTLNLGGSGFWTDQDFMFSVASMQLTDSITFHFDINAGGSNAQQVYIQHIETIVPEPSTCALFGFGGLYFLLRRKQT
ncbi:MAG TPA: PEP-CTERM sorting domain-containing protein [Fimbriimonadaceae bacterium]|nr:PEP-CTERM sorting domain-containing protein [Fimbriimonadaceae bacterium]